MLVMLVEPWLTKSLRGEAILLDNDVLPLAFGFALLFGAGDLLFFDLRPSAGAD